MQFLSKLISSLLFLFAQKNIFNKREKKKNFDENHWTNGTITIKKIC